MFTDQLYFFVFYLNFISQAHLKGQLYLPPFSSSKSQLFMFTGPVQFSLFMHPDQAQNTLSGIQGQEATAVAVIFVTALTSSRKTTKYK